MLNATFVRVRRSEVPRLRAWLRDLRARREELAESYRLQGTRHERFFLVDVPGGPEEARGADGPLLVLLSELEDTDRGGTAFLRSRAPLDVEFKTLIQEIARDELEPELLYDSSALLDEPAPAEGPRPVAPGDGSTGS